jgi:hypothetical protein
VKARQGRGRSAPRSAIQQRYRFRDVLLWTMVDAVNPPGPHTVVSKDSQAPPEEPAVKAVINAHSRRPTQIERDVAEAVMSSVASQITKAVAVDRHGCSV